MIWSPDWIQQEAVMLPGKFLVRLRAVRIYQFPCDVTFSLFPSLLNTHSTMGLPETSPPSADCHQLSKGHINGDSSANEMA